MTRYPRSEEMLARALKVTPGGCQTRSKRTTQFPQPYPAYLDWAYGAQVTDVDGHHYIDWICALGAISLGHGHPDVDDAVRNQMTKGVSFSLATPLEVEVAEQLCEVIPCAESVRFVKTGSEATEGAMRIARLATGKNHIISIGYHSWHSVFDAAKPSHPGVPPEIASVITEVPYGGDVSFTADTAAVIVEAVRDEAPHPEWLKAIRTGCNITGALLIFDEVVSGFRWAIGGAQEYFGVTPDLATFGKGFANGYPLAAICGRRDIMDHASYVSGTFGGECLSLAAAHATIEVFRREPVIKRMWDSGQALIDGFNKLGSDMQLAGYAVHPRLIGDPARTARFISLLAEEGALWHPKGFNVSYSHTEYEVDQTLKACARVLERMQ